MIVTQTEVNRKEIEAMKKKIEEIETLHKLQNEAAKQILEEYKKLNP